MSWYVFSKDSSNVRNRWVSDGRNLSDPSPHVTETSLCPLNKRTWKYTVHSIQLFVTTLWRDATSFTSSCAQKKNFTGLHISCGSFITHHPLSLGKMTAHHFISTANFTQFCGFATQIKLLTGKQNIEGWKMTYIVSPPQKKNSNDTQKTSKSCGFHVVIKTWNPWHEPGNPGCFMEILISWLMKSSLKKAG